MTCICWLHGSCPVDKPGDKHFLQPRSQGSLLPALRSVGRVGENPGNEVALSPLDTYESYNSTKNVSGFPLVRLDYHYTGSLTNKTSAKISQGGASGNSWWGCAARFFKSWPDFRPKNVILHTRFQTRTLKSQSFSDLTFRQKLCYHYSD